MASEAKQMFSNPGEEPAVTAAWESFLNGDQLPADALRALIDSSWQRCLSAQVDPRARSGPQPVSDQDLYLLRERQRELLEASAPVMACARDFLSETGTLMAPDTAWQVYREYTCPQCGALHDVEAPTPWYPVLHDFEPDIDAFYREWVKLPLPERVN